MEDAYFRKITTTIILAGLIVLSFFLVRPLLFSVIGGFILAFIFSPIYNWLFKRTKSKNFPAILICAFLILVIILPLWFFTPMILDQSIKFYQSSQQLDIITPLQKIFPSLFGSLDFSQEVGSIISSFITKLTNSLMNTLSNLILEFPIILMQIFVVFFTFFYAVRDKDNIINYIKSLLPFSKEVERKLFNSTRDITFSVLYGYIVMGIIQGLILGAGFLIFGVPNAFILLILAILVGILPAVGPFIIGAPVMIYLFLGGNTFSALGILAFTLFSSLSDPLIRPILVSHRLKLHNGVVFLGMIGGFIFFGVLGFILGPLILAYLLIVIEIYRNKRTPSVFINKEKN